METDSQEQFHLIGQLHRKLSNVWSFSQILTDHTLNHLQTYDYLQVMYD